MTPRRPRVAVVLAAGRSVRMRTGAKSKLLSQLAGMSLVERTVRTVAREVERVVVVVGHDGERVGACALRAAPGQVEVIHAAGWEQGSGATLVAAEQAVRGNELSLVLVADHVFGGGILRALVEAGRPAALVDPAAPPEVLEEATRVVVSGGRAISFGKDERSQWADCGAFILPPRVFQCHREASAAGDQSLAGAVSRLARSCPVAAVPIAGGGWWQDVDTPADLRRARDRLRRSLASPTDGPVARLLNRPLSTRLSLLLAPLRLPPDLVSTAVFGLGVLAGVFLAAGQQLLGAVLVQATSVLDGVDGELARIQLRESRRGAMLDGVLDRCADTAMIAGLGLWSLSRGLGPIPALLLAVAATAASLLSMATKDRVAALGLPRAPERMLGMLLGGRDGRLLLIALLAAFGQPGLGLLAIAASGGITAALRVYLVAVRHPADRPPRNR